LSRKNCKKTSIIFTAILHVVGDEVVLLYKGCEKQRARPLSLSLYPVFPVLKAGIAGERRYYAKQEVKIQSQSNGIRTVLYVKVDIGGYLFLFIYGHKLFESGHELFSNQKKPQEKILACFVQI